MGALLWNPPERNGFIHPRSNQKNLSLHLGASVHAGGHHTHHAFPFCAIRRRQLAVDLDWRVDESRVRAKSALSNCTPCRNSVRGRRVAARHGLSAYVDGRFIAWHPNGKRIHSAVAASHPVL
jgi:hypothetical protein